MLSLASFVTGICALFLMTVETTANRVPRRTGDQPSLGSCLAYTRGGTTRLHWYSCCNNCENGFNSTCPSTYQSASNEQYCDKCGVDTSKGNGRPRSGGQQFNCGGCQGQAVVDRKCRSWWKEIPGFCWAYSLCFQIQCKGKYKDCGNRVCDGGETVENCPIDCCDLKSNPCCGEPGCCSTEISSGGRMLRVLFKYIIALVVIIGLAKAVLKCTHMWYRRHHSDRLDGGVDTGGDTSPCRRCRILGCPSGKQ